MRQINYRLRVIDRTGEGRPINAGVLTLADYQLTKRIGELIEKNEGIKTIATVRLAIPFAGFVDLPANRMDISEAMQFLNEQAEAVMQDMDTVKAR